MPIYLRDLKPNRCYYTVATGAPATPWTPLDMVVSTWVYIKGAKSAYVMDGFSNRGREVAFAEWNQFLDWKFQQSRNLPANTPYRWFLAEREASTGAYFFPSFYSRDELASMVKYEADELAREERNDRRNRRRKK
jgi:hypothetical protein